MDLRTTLTRWALARPHVILVAAPASTALRWDVEAALQRRGWPQPDSPADADLLLSLGELGPDLSAALDVLWGQVPRPRHRAHLDAAGDVEGWLEQCAAALLTPAATAPDPQQDSGHDTSAGDDHQSEPDEHAGHDMDGDQHASHDTGGDQHASHDTGGDQHASHDTGGDQHAGHDTTGHDTSGHDMSGDEHAGHDMGGDDMGGMHAGHDMGGDVAGLPMADTAPDRDGLQLDALTVSLGPVLTGWPTGLVVTGSLQGDVLTDISARVLGPTGAGPGAHGGPPPHALAPLQALDGLERFALVAGWTRVARDAAWLRAALRGGDQPEPAARNRGRAMVTRVRTSRTLRWAAGDRHGTLQRVHHWCDVVEQALASTTTTDADVPLTDPADLGDLLDGLDVGSARLVVASLTVDLATAEQMAGQR